MIVLIELHEQAVESTKNSTTPLSFHHQIFIQARKLWSNSAPLSLPAVLDSEIPLTVRKAVFIHELGDFCAS